MQVLDLDIRIKSLEEALSSSEATLRGEASLAAAKVLLFVFFSGLPIGSGSKKAKVTHKSRNFF
jgi:hypothetical protein